MMNTLHSDLTTDYTLTEDLHPVHRAYQEKVARGEPVTIGEVDDVYNHCNLCGRPCAAPLTCFACTTEALKELKLVQLVRRYAYLAKSTAIMEARIKQARREQWLIAKHFHQSGYSIVVEGQRYTGALARSNGIRDIYMLIHTHRPDKDKDKDKVEVRNKGQRRAIEAVDALEAELLCKPYMVTKRVGDEELARLHAEPEDTSEAEAAKARAAEVAAALAKARKLVK